MSEDSHIHTWVWSYTYEDWWDGDEEEVYVCTEEGCKAIKRESTFHDE